MKYFTRLLRTLQTNPYFNYHPTCAKLKLIQLEFADDLLMFYRGNIGSVTLLNNCCKEFSMASGLRENLEKILQAQEQQEILEELGYTKGELPIRYLGVPLSTKKITAAQCKPLLDKMVGWITSWTTKFLSYAGRV